MGTLRIYNVSPDPTATFTPDELSTEDFGEVVARYRMEVGWGDRLVHVTFAVAVKPLGQGEEFVSACPEYTREFIRFLMELDGNPFRSPPRWSRVLSSVVESVHRGIERVFPDEYITLTEPSSGN